MKLNNNTKKVLLFVALILAAYLISLACGGKNDTAPQGTSSVAELETGVLEPEAEDRSSASVTESEAELTAQEGEPETEIPEAAPAGEKTTEAETTEPETTEAETTESETTEAETTESETTEAETTEPETTEAETEKPGITVKEDGEYTDKEHVALYIHTYGHLPSNFITKDEAKELGWQSDNRSLGEVAPGKSIGGDYFGNYEGLLPKKKGRKYYECDIDFKGKSRGAKRIIYSNDGLIFYTDDHYESFEQLYGGD